MHLGPPQDFRTVGLSSIPAPTIYKARRVASSFLATEVRRKRGIRNTDWLVWVGVCLISNRRMCTCVFLLLLLFFSSILHAAMHVERCILDQLPVRRLSSGSVSNQWKGRVREREKWKRARVAAALQSARARARLRMRVTRSRGPPWSRHISRDLASDRDDERARA